MGTPVISQSSFTYKIKMFSYLSTKYITYIYVINILFKIMPGRKKRQKIRNSIQIFTYYLDCHAFLTLLTRNFLSTTDFCNPLIVLIEGFLLFLYILWTNLLNRSHVIKLSMTDCIYNCFQDDLKLISSISRPSITIARINGASAITINRMIKLNVFYHKQCDNDVAHFNVKDPSNFASQ